MLYLRTLGELSLRSGGPDGPILLSRSNGLGILAFLATLPGRTASREHVAELFWPDSDLRRARQSLRQALFYLSKQVDEPPIDTEDSTLTLLDTHLDVDLWDLQAALTAGDYARVVERYEGRFLAGFDRRVGPELAEWIGAENDRIQAGIQVAFERLIERSLEAGDREAAADLARRYVEINPLNERAQLLLVRTLKATDADVEALQAYEAYRSLVRDALDGEPSEELERAVERIRQAILPEAGDGAAAPPGDAAQRPERAWPRVGHLVIATALGGVATAAILFLAIGSRLWTNPASAGPFDSLAARLLVVASEEGSVRIEEAEIRQGATTVRSTELDPRENPAPSPDGRNVAVLHHTSGGYDLAIRHRESGRLRILDASRDDARARDWSPDGRYLLYTSGRPRAGAGSYSHRLMVYDMELDRPRPLTDYWDGVMGSAVWSPDGTRIALVAGHEDDTEIHVLDADGRRSVNISSRPGSDAEPTWSPDGRWLAFVNKRSGSADIVQVAPDGSEARLVLDGPLEERSPVWLSPSVLAFVQSPRSSPGNLWAVDLHTRERHQLTQTGDITKVWGTSLVETRDWLERITITTPLQQLAPGQTVPLQFELRDATGAQFTTARQLPLRFSVLDTTIAMVAGPGKLRALRSGRTRLIVSAGGWRADTVDLAVATVTAREIRPEFVETWREGIAGDRWLPFGKPTPYTVRTDRSDGSAALVSNGDSNYSSGLATRRAFPLQDGLTVEVWGRLPFTGRLYQTFDVVISSDQPPSDGSDWYHQRRIVKLHLNGPTPEAPPHTQIYGLMFTEPVDLPEHPERWHLYALQVEPDGTVSLIVDGELTWRSTEPLPTDALTEGYVVLSGNSIGTEILHGPVSVYRGPRYLITSELEHGDSGR